MRTPPRRWLSAIRVSGRAALLLLLALPCGVALAGEGTAKPQCLTFLGLNAKGAEEWVRAADGAVVIRVPRGPYQRRPYEGTEAVKAPEPLEVESFFVDRTEVTNAQFARFLAANPEAAKTVVPRVPGLVRGEDGSWSAAPGLERHPVTAATGRGMLAYAAWVGGRIPSQSEWEKAAGGAEGLLYPWGSETPDALRANGGRPGSIGLLPVGSFAGGASPYGVLDMAGNAYDRVTTRRGNGPEAPVMLKGGSWLSTHPLNLRVLDLCMQSLDAADASVGFRCAMDDAEPARPTRVRQPAPTLRLARDFDEAVAEAKRRHVPLFLALLYDTCGQCDRTRAQVYSDPRFVAYANEHLVVVIGHHPGDALTDPHPPNEDGSCPLYPGISCDEHEVLFQRGSEVVGEFFSPGTFLLHPDRVKVGTGTAAYLIGDAEFPKSGGDVDAYLAAFERARQAMK